SARRQSPPGRRAPAASCSRALERAEPHRYRAEAAALRRAAGVTARCIPRARCRADGRYSRPRRILPPSAWSAKRPRRALPPSAVGRWEIAGAAMPRPPAPRESSQLLAEEVLNGLALVVQLARLRAAAVPAALIHPVRRLKARVAPQLDVGGAPFRRACLDEVAQHGADSVAAAVGANVELVQLHAAVGQRGESYATDDAARSLRHPEAPFQAA